MPEAVRGHQLESPAVPGSEQVQPGQSHLTDRSSSHPGHGYQQPERSLGQQSPHGSAAAAQQVNQSAPGHQQAQQLSSSHGGQVAATSHHQQQSAGSGQHQMHAAQFAHHVSSARPGQNQALGPSSGPGHQQVHHTSVGHGKDSAASSQQPKHPSTASHQHVTHRLASHSGHTGSSRHPEKQQANPGSGGHCPSDASAGGHCQTAHSAGHLVNSFTARNLQSHVTGSGNQLSASAGGPHHVPVTEGNQRARLPLAGRFRVHPANVDRQRQLVGADSHQMHPGSISSTEKQPANASRQDVQAVAAKHQHVEPKTNAHRQAELASAGRSQPNQQVKQSATHHQVLTTSSQLREPNLTKHRAGMPKSPVYQQVPVNASDRPQRQPGTSGHHQAQSGAPGPQRVHPAVSDHHQRHPVTTGHQQTSPAATGHQQTPTAVTGQQQTPTAVTEHQRTPTAVTGQRQTPNTVTGQQTPNTITGHQQTPNTVSGQQQTPTAVTGQQQTPTAVTEHQRTPTAVTGHQQTPTAVSEHQQTSFAAAEHRQMEPAAVSASACPSAAPAAPEDADAGRNRMGFQITSITPSRADEPADAADESGDDDAADAPVTPARAPPPAADSPAAASAAARALLTSPGVSVSEVLPVIPTVDGFGITLVPGAVAAAGRGGAGELLQLPSELEMDLMASAAPDRRDQEVWQSRFKVVKIETNVPFKCGRWQCMDYRDQPKPAAGEAAPEPAPEAMPELVPAGDAPPEWSPPPAAAGSEAGAAPPPETPRRGDEPAAAAESAPPPPPPAAVASSGLILPDLLPNASLLELVRSAVGDGPPHRHADSASPSGGTSIDSKIEPIDNKIEQAMDLVKSHLLLAVREEVDVLKANISKLVDKISVLERENEVLKTNASPEVLAQLEEAPAAAAPATQTAGWPQAAAAPPPAGH